MSNLEQLQRRFDRERIARKEAERLGEVKTRELFVANQRLTTLKEELEDAVRQRTRELERTLARTEALYRASRLIGDESVVTMLQVVVDNVVDALDADRVQLTSIDYDARQILHTAKGGTGADALQDFGFDELMQGLSGRAIGENQPAIAAADAIQTTRRLAGAGAAAVVPLSHRNSVVGTLTAVSKPEQPDFSPDDLELLVAVANQVAVAVSNTQLFEEMREARHAAEAANRAKSRFLASMSHELRTPLNGILGYAQILRRDTQLPQKVHNAAAVIQGSGDHLLTLINDILDISKIEAEKMELVPHEFHLHKFLDTIAGIIGTQAQNGQLQFNYELHSNVPAAVLGDELRLRQVLLNLLGNAVKYTTEGHIGFTVGLHHGAIRFVVEDSGVGIPEESIEDIFEPFRQVEDRKLQVEGTGLGLAICSRLVNMMGSTLRVESRYGVGSRFWFDLKLPVADSFVVAQENERRQIIGYEGAVRTVLVADDREANRTILRDVLDPLGFKLIEAVDGKAAVEAALTHKPELILMDLVMPVMDGFEATTRLRSGGSAYHPVIIAVSASVFDINREDCLRAGLDDYVVKPVDIDHLLDVIAEQLGVQWKMPQQAGSASAGAADVVQDAKLPLTPPHPEILQRFFALALIGDVDGIQTELASMHEQLEPFARFRDELERLTEDFRLDDVQKLIEECLAMQE